MSKTLILILACLVVGGCETREDVYWNLQPPPVFDPVPFALDTTPRLSLGEFPDSALWAITESVFVAMVKEQPDPCSPCPDSTIILRDQMPPGRWVTSRFFCGWCEIGGPRLPTYGDWPDSVFILSGE